MQQNIQTNVHPYCLALDNLNIALHSFVQEEYLLKNKDNGLMRHNQNASTKTLKQLEIQLLRYCNLVPFKYYYEPADEEVQRLSSKL